MIKATSKNMFLRLPISINEEAIRFNGDRERLSEAFSDIIDNAIKYNNKNGNVDVTLNKRDASVEIAITDKGIGVALEEQAKIFDRFYRVDSSRSLTTGSGLGLSITKAIVEAHGGKIELESSPGEGSCFTVILPISGLNQESCPRLWSSRRIAGLSAFRRSLP
jgi:signal transduction histidine kinase